MLDSPAGSKTAARPATPPPSAPPQTPPQLKERQKEDHLYQNEERFVTAAYRKKLEEDKRWQEEMRKRWAPRAGPRRLAGCAAA